MLGRNRSLRSRRQPITKPEDIVASPIEHTRVVSPANLSQRTNDHGTSSPRPLALSQDRSGYPQTLAQNPASGSQTSSAMSEPPESMIGVALGSPGKSPLPPFPPEDSIPWTTTNAKLQDHISPRPNDQQGQYSKASRWKTFGGFFGKRSGLNQASPAASSHPFANRASPLGPHGDRDTSESPKSSVQSSLERHAILHTESGPPRDWIGPSQLPSPPDRERRTLRKKPSLRRDQFAQKQKRDVRKPSVPKADSSMAALESSPKSLPKDAPLGSGVRQARAKASLLQVDIPDVEFERYSVMFSSLLQPCPQSSTTRQPSPTRQPSLLVRRQASLGELHTTPVTSFERPWMHREHSSSSRAASPHKSPSFSLFPPSPITTGRRPENSSRERSPLHRSATTPGAISPSKAMFDFTPNAVSPNKAKFDFGTDETDQVIVIVHTPTEQQPKACQFSKNQSSVSSSDAQSFVTARSSPAPEQQQQHGSRSLPTPTSQPRNPSPRRPSPAGRSASQNRSNANNARQLSPAENRSAAPEPRLDKLDNRIRNPSPAAARTRSPLTHHAHSPPTTTVNDPLREAAEISIARQISISQRQRRQLLLSQSVAPQPVQPKIVDAKGGGNASRKSHHSHHLVLEDA